jgi:hypothetical protein
LEPGMWRTSAGDRALSGSEARLFASGLGYLLEELESEQDDYISGVTVFDRLTHGQRVVVLDEVANGLLREETPTPPHTAANEAAIAAVFRTIRELIELETDEDPAGLSGPDSSIRRLVREACWDQQLRVSIPWIGTEDPEEWESCTSELTDQILWDRDFEDEDTFVDAPPEETQQRLELACISEEYYGAVPADPESKDVDRLVAGVRSLCRKVTRQSGG